MFRSSSVPKGGGGSGGATGLAVRSTTSVVPVLLPSPSMVTAEPGLLTSAAETIKLALPAALPIKFAMTYVKICWEIR